MVQELPCFNNSIKLDPLLAISLDIFFHNMITIFLLYAFRGFSLLVSFVLLSLRCPIMVGNKVKGDTH
jgi:hypothetical protein